MGSVHFGVPADLVARLREETGLALAVETGTFLGASTVVLAGLFDRVWSLESSAEYVEAAGAALHRAGCADRVRLVHGDSATCLADVLREVPGPALFWLDGHWSPWMPVDDGRQCPLLAELAAIAAWPHAAGSVLLVDDLSVFRERPDDGLFRPADWPTVGELTGRLADGFAGHRAEEVDDVLVVRPRAVPAAVR